MRPGRLVRVSGGDGVRGAAPELAALLRGLRRRARPGATGSGGDRRTPGLRREELALAAGVSVDYLVQLEQGRATRPSASVVAALARSLLLDADQGALLHRAAGLAAPARPVSREVPPGVRRMVDRLAWPVAVYSADWWLLAWNPGWSALLGDPAGQRGRTRNVVWFEMTQPSPRVWVDPAEGEAYRDAVVGDLRVALVEHPDDAELVDLVAALRSASPEFVERWEAARPARFVGMRKHVDHPDVGPLVLDGDVLQAPGSDLRLVVYSPAPGTPDADRLARLVGVGAG